MAPENGYDEKLERILRIATEVFAEKGYHQASIRDISRATGVSLSGLYYYVESKEQLLFRIQEHSFEQVVENLEELLEGIEDPNRRLRLLVENHLRFFVANMQEMKVLSHEADSLSGDYRRRVNDMKKRYSQVCVDILEELRPEDSPIDTRVAAYSLFGMMNWIYNWYRPDRDVPVEELAADMSHLFLRGFLEADMAVIPPGASEGAPGEARPSIWKR